jgi:hypothetical protein
MMTKDEARRALEAELRSRKLAKPMTLEELNVFCEEMADMRHSVPDSRFSRNCSGCAFHHDIKPVPRVFWISCSATVRMRNQR